MSAVDDIFAELIDSFRNQEVWVFAGAGISVSSGLPSVSQLVPHALSKLGVSKEDVKSYMESRFCFEEFLQILLQFSDPDDAHEILDLFREGKPNINHTLLAKLVKSGCLKTIITTNFDLLIESALEAQGLQRGEDFEVFHREEDFENIDWSDSRPCVVKIHGSIEDSGAMAITLQQVARRELSSRRRGIIERAFSTGAHRSVLVLGYSSSDVFDISPHIATLEGELKRVILVEHVGSSANPSAENLALRDEKNPFKQFEGSQRAYYNTDILVKTLWSSLLTVKAQRSRRGTTRWRECVDNWCRLASFGGRGGGGIAIAGRLFYSVSEFKTAMKYLNRAASRFAWYEDERDAVDVLLGNICVRLGDLERAVIAYYGPAFERVKATGSTRSLIALMTSAAGLFSEHGESDKASLYYSQAFSKARELGDEKEVIAVQTEWGNAWNHSGKFLLAKGVLATALEKTDKIGDVRTKASILGYLGDCHAGLEEYGKAISYYEQAIEADRNLGNKGREGVHFANAGDTYVKLGQHQRAIDCFQHALRIADAMGDDERQAIALAVLGSVHFATGAYQDAIREYREALRICASGGDEGESRGESPASARLRRLRLQERRAHDQRFSEFLEELEESGLEGTPEGTEAFQEWALKERELLKKSETPVALERRDPVLTMRLKADAWVGLGSCYMKLGDYRAAIEAYEEGEMFVSLTDQRKHSSLVSILGDLRRRLQK